MVNIEELKQEIATKYGDNAQYIIKSQDVKNELEFIEWYYDHRDETNISDNFFRNEVMRRAEFSNKYMLTPATAKVGGGATLHLWTDAYACTIIKVTRCSVTVRRDKATLDPDFKPEWIIGGFAGHCTNQDEQTYTYEPDPNGTEYTIRWSKKYNSYGRPGDYRLTAGRHEFYDYNF